MIGRALPPLDLTDADLARALDKVADAASDAVYVTVGFSVVTIQRAQVRRRELARDRLALLDDLDERFSELESRFDGAVDEILDGLRERMPSPAAEAVEHAVGAARQARRHLRSRIRGRLGLSS